MRIWPAFAVSMLIYLAFIEIFRLYYPYGEHHWVGQFLREYSLGDIFRYLSLTFNITGPDGLFITPYWSLPVEFQYYLLLPFCVFFMKGRIASATVPILFGFTLYWLDASNLVEIDRNEVLKMGFTFFGGVFLAQWYWQRKKLNKKNELPHSVTLILLFVSACTLIAIKVDWLFVSESLPFIGDRWNLFGVFALLFVAIALFSKPVEAKHWLLDFLQYYGQISYSIYLFHMLSIGVAAILITNLAIYGDELKLFFVLTFTLVTSFFFSVYSYRYVELPAMRLGRRLIALQYSMPKYSFKSLIRG